MRPSLLTKKSGGQTGCCRPHRSKKWCMLAAVLAILILRATQPSQDGALFLLWTVEKETTIVTTNDRRDSAINPTAVPTASASAISSPPPPPSTWNEAGFRADRSIVFVHVGKAGGLVIRRATSLVCLLAPKKYNTLSKMQHCIEAYFHPHAVLSRQTIGYMHMHSVNEKQDSNVTKATRIMLRGENTTSSFLFVLRNPVDRIISSYRYSHPQNCNDQYRPRLGDRPWGCQVEELLEPRTPEQQVMYSTPNWIRERQAARQFYQDCFPNAAMEEFAQSTLSPWNHSSNVIKGINNDQQNYTCRALARNYAQGKGRMTPNPHMRYNYAYYMNQSQRTFREESKGLGPSLHPEIFGVRTEHLWDDLTQLDTLLGGTGHFRSHGQAVRHGSDQYVASPLSSQAYHKLCCVLERELQVYLNLLMDLVVNLNHTTKAASRQELLDKCGIPINGWTEWRAACRMHLQEDERVIRKLLPPAAPVLNHNNNDKTPAV